MQSELSTLALEDDLHPGKRERECVLTATSFCDCDVKVKVLR